VADIQGSPFGAVLTGGRSSRFGSDKAAARFRGAPLLDRALGILRAAGVQSLSYVGGAPRKGVPHDAIHLPDRTDLDPGPLRGILTVLDHCWKDDRGSTSPECVVVIACDLPLLRASSVTRLIEASSSFDAVVASGRRDHWSVLALRATSRPLLHASYRDGARSVGAATSRLQLGHIAVDEDELANVNDTAALEQIIADDPPNHR